VFSAGHQIRSASTSCAPAQLLSALPASYPVQKNLLSVFPHSVWSVTLPRSADPYTLSFVATARNAEWTVRNSFTLNS
jgi:hypothetical protein